MNDENKSKYLRLALHSILTKKRNMLSELMLDANTCNIISSLFQGNDEIKADKALKIIDEIDKKAQEIIKLFDSLLKL